MTMPDDKTTPKTSVAQQGAVDILRAARERIADSTKWCQGSRAQDASGCAVRSDSTRAVSWCAEGAILAETPDKESPSAAFSLLTNEAAMQGHGDYINVNDNLGHAAVLRLFDAAIAKATGETL